MSAGNDRVVFGHMHEDHSIELSLVNCLPVKRAMVIASGGDLAFALAGEKVDVIAVDSNPAQIALVRLKMERPENRMDLCFCGRVDRVLALGGPSIAWLMDWPRSRPGAIRGFLTNCLEGLLHRVVSLVHGATAGEKLDHTGIRLIRRRLEHALRQPDAGRNPLLQVLLGNRFGSESPEVWSLRGMEKWQAETARISLMTGDLSQVLDGTPHGSLGLISVSNLPDTMDQPAWDRLVANALPALAAGGYLIARSMLRETVESKSDRWFATEALATADASPLCPVIWVGRKI